MTDEEKLKSLLSATAEEVHVREYGKPVQKHLLAWINWFVFDSFTETVRDYFGRGIFDDGGFEVHVLDGSVCVEIDEMLCDYDIDFEELMGKDYVE